MNSLEEFSPVFVFLIVSVLFTLVPIVIAKILAPRSQGEKRLETYECGIEPFGSAWIRYSIHYYMYALIFIAFDVDVLYLFPAATSYARGAKPEEFFAVLFFVLIIVLAVIYAWGKGVFTWKRKLSR